MINDFFNWCVLVLEIMAEHTGMSIEVKLRKNMNTINLKRL